MTRKSASICILFFWAFGANAQSLVVRSGEHGDFTRLTASLLPSEEWRIDALDRKLVLSLSSPQQGIDTANVFQRIERNRVTSISPSSDGGGMEIFLGCDCGFNAYRFSETLLVIDIGETLPRAVMAGSQSVKSNNGPNNLLATGRMDFPLFFDKTNAPVFPKSDVDTAMNLLTQDSLRRMDLKPTLTNTRSPEDLVPENSLDPSTLKQEIGRATRQGLLVPADVQVPGDPGGSEKTVLPNLRARLATEVLPVGRIDTDEQTADSACIEKDDLDLASWGHPMGFSKGLSVWTKELIRDLDRVDTKAVIGLARHYLHHGFGAEAIATLSMIDVPDAGTQILNMLGRIIDNGYDPQGGALATMSGCRGPAALWSVLARQDLSDAHELNITDLRFAFEELPIQLKQHLGPTLAARLSAAGEGRTSEEIMANLERSTPGKTPEIEHAGAMIDLQAGETDKAVEPLERVVQSNSAMSPLALVALIDKAVEADQSIDLEQVELVASYLFENRRSSLARDLSRAYILALAHSGQFSEALDRLEIDRANSVEATDAFTASRVFSRLAAYGSDLEFLASTVRPQPEGLSSEVENNVAGRLLSLGFPEAASRFLATAADGETGRQRRILRAQVALEMKQPTQAEAELLGLSGDDVTDLRVEARKLAGNYLAALAGLEGQSQATRHREIAWLAGDWEALAASGDDPLSQAARLMIEASDQMAPTRENPESGVLGRTENLISESGESRAVIESILNQFQVEATQEP